MTKSYAVISISLNTAITSPPNPLIKGTRKVFAASF
jgi:hypothetical protein